MATSQADNALTAKIAQAAGQAVAQATAQAKAIASRQAGNAPVSNANSATAKVAANEGNSTDAQSASEPTSAFERATQRSYAKPAAHKRPVKHPEKYYEDYARVLEADPFEHRGNWRAHFAKRFGKAYTNATPLHVDFGCGKGQFTTQLALGSPDILVIGIDYEIDCVVRAAYLANEAGAEHLDNLLFFYASADDVNELFAPGEIDVMHLNFSTPFPKRKHANMRLTYADKLLKYRTALAEGGRIEMMTDSQPLFDYSLTQFEQTGYSIPWMSRNLYEGSHSTNTEYEQRLTAKGAHIHALHAVPDMQPKEEPYTGPESLVEFLPEDLESLTYVPLGMEDTVVNIINRRAREKRHAEKANQ